MKDIFLACIFLIIFYFFKFILSKIKLIHEEISFIAHLNIDKKLKIDQMYHDWFIEKLSKFKSNNWIIDYKSKKADDLLINLFLHLSSNPGLYSLTRVAKNLHELSDIIFLFDLNCHYNQDDESWLDSFYYGCRINIILDKKNGIKEIFSIFEQDELLGNHEDLKRYNFTHGNDTHCDIIFHEDLIEQIGHLVMGSCNPSIIVKMKFCTLINSNKWSLDHENPGYYIIRKSAHDKEDQS